MRVEYFTLGMQLIILGIMGCSTWFSFRTSKLTRQTTTMIEGYRRELGWLMARLDALEAERGARVGK